MTWKTLSGSLRSALERIVPVSPAIRLELRIVELELRVAVLGVTLAAAIKPLTQEQTQDIEAAIDAARRGIAAQKYPPRAQKHASEMLERAIGDTRTIMGLPPEPPPPHP